MVKVRPTQLAGAGRARGGRARRGAAKMRKQTRDLALGHAGRHHPGLAGAGLGGRAGLRAPDQPAAAPGDRAGGGARRWRTPSALVLAFAIITFLHIVLRRAGAEDAGHSQPGGHGARRWRCRCGCSRLLLWPVIALLNAGTRQVLRVLGLEVTPGRRRGARRGRAEAGVRQLGRGGRRSPARGPSCSSARSSMMEKTARQVLVPRTQMKYLDLEATLDENIAGGAQRGPHLAAGGAAAASTRSRAW